MGSPSGGTLRPPAHGGASKASGGGCGKADFAATYDHDHPGPYFSALRPLRYQTPQHARPIFRRCIEALRRLRRPEITVLDLCCGYGVNAALLNHRVTLDELYALYAARGTGTSDARLARERDFFRRRRLSRGHTVRVIGVDVARSAIAYARRVGLLDAGFGQDLEAAAPAGHDAELLATADLVTITGGFSYVGGNAIAHLLGAFPPHRLPWIAAFPLRYGDFSDVVKACSRFGLVTEPWGHASFPHRRFVDETERAALHGSLDTARDPVHAPLSPGYLDAVFYLSRPAPEAARVPLERVVEGPPARGVESNALPGCAGHP